MFSTRQKLFLRGAVLLSVLLVVGSYFGSRWLFGPDVKPTPEHLLTAKPSYATSVSHDTPSVSGTDWVSELEESLSDTDAATESDPIQIDEDLEAQLAALSDEDLTALAEALEQDEGESSKYPAVPNGFPMTPVWLEDYFDEDSHADHVTISRVLIKLWNQGDRDFVNGVYENGKVYPLYRDVVYVEWRTESYTGPDGEKIEFPYISSGTATHARGDPRVNTVGAGLFTIEEMISGAYKTKYPGLKLVDYEDAGYDPATFLDDH